MKSMEFIAIQGEIGDIKGGVKKAPRCSHCGVSSKNYEPGPDTVILFQVSGRKWPPMVNTFTGFVFVTSAVKELIESRISPGFTNFCRIAGVEIEGQPPRDPQPSYHLLITAGNLNVEIPEEDFNTCLLCGVSKRKTFGDLKKPLLIEAGSWNGSPIVRMGNLYHWMIFFERGLLDHLKGRFPEEIYGSNLIASDDPSREFPRKTVRCDLPRGEEIKPEQRLSGWEIIERHFGKPVSSYLKGLFSFDGLETRMPIRVRTKEKIDEDYHVDICRLSTIGAGSLKTFREDLIEIAENGDCGLILVNPVAEDSEVFFYQYDVARLDETGLKLSEFVAALTGNEGRMRF